MGFEIKYKYQNIVEGVVEESILEGSIKVGSPYEEVSLEMVAGKIIALMAKRKIQLGQIEVFEIVKKPINFKENEEGIVLKNKKFKFDDGAPVVGEVVESNNDNFDELLKNPKLLEALKKISSQSTTVPAVVTTPANAPQNTSQMERPLRYAYYSLADVTSEFSIHLMRQKIADFDNKFTIGRKYPIFEEKSFTNDKPWMKLRDQEVVNYIAVRVIDNTGMQQWVSDSLFSTDNPLKKTNETDLWKGVETQEAPILRRRR